LPAKHGRVPLAPGAAAGGSSNAPRAALRPEHLAVEGIVVDQPLWRMVLTTRLVRGREAHRCPHRRPNSAARTRCRAASPATILKLELLAAGHLQKPWIDRNRGPGATPAGHFFATYAP
jgi:hypothetical protein